MQNKFSVGAWFLAALLISSRTPAGQYFQDFSGFPVGATNFGDGSQLFSTALGSSSGAEVQDGTYHELALTESGDGNVTSAFELPDLDPGVPIYAFSAKWNSQVDGNFPSAADGFSFNFGPLASSNLISGAVESGYGVGLGFDVQTYTGNNPGFYLRVNGAKYASVTNNPATQWGTNSTARHFWEVDWNYTNGVTVRVDGQTIFSNVSTYGLTPNAGDRFVWAARCGSLNEEVRLDNIVVMTGGNLIQAPTTSPYFTDQDNQSRPPDAAFDGNLNDYWITFNPDGYVGATVSPAATAQAYVLVSTPNIGAGSGDDPKSWTLQGSNNGGTNWIACGAGGGYFLNRDESRAWLATNSTAYGAYRLNISQNNGGEATALGELRFYAFKAYNPTWQKISVGSEMEGDDWPSIAISADGSVVAAATTGDDTWVYNSGSWDHLFDDGINVSPLVIPSANKDAIVGVINGGDIYYIPDYHTYSWGGDGVGNYSWAAITCSSDGMKQAAAVYNGVIATTTDGHDFTFQYSSAAGNWTSLASSADGATVFGATASYGIYRSLNGGTNFTLTSASSDLEWTSIACSADGTRLVACADNFPPDGGVFISTDSGTNWTKCLSTSTNFYFVFSHVASSADGKTLIAAGEGLFVSRDAGATWYEMVPTNSYPTWHAVACSADGSKFVVASVPIPGYLPSGIWFYDIGTVTVPTILSQNASTAAFGGTSATLNAQINPNNLESTAWFQWGDTMNYGNATALQDIGSGGNPVGISANLTGLTPGLYHFRAAATNVAGTAYGTDASFFIPATNAFFNVAFAGDAMVPTSTNSPAGQGASEGIDGTASTKYLNLDITNTGFTIFPSITNVTVQALGLISAEDEPERDPASFALYGSHDGTNFTLIASNSVPPFAARNAIQSFAFANTNTYAAYKIIFPTVQDPDTANSMQIAEVEFLPSADILSPGNALSPGDALALLLPNGASLNGGGPANALMDRLLGADANKIVVLNDTANVVALITPVAGASIVKGFELIGGDDDATYPQREPSSFTLEGSNDGTNFVTLTSVPLQAPTANMQIQGFSCLGNTNAYTKYRATFGPPQSSETLQVGELRLFGVKLGGVVSVPWTLTSAPSNQWSSVASSADGTKLAAASSNLGSGEIYVSTNSGATWTLTSAPSYDWQSIASSADGNELAAAAYSDAHENPGSIYTSTNSGITWAQTSAPSNYWQSIASSADGTKLAAVNFYNTIRYGDGNFHPGGIYTSTNSGGSWTLTSAPSNYWQSIASSADGTKLAAADLEATNGNPGSIFTSTNSGTTWAQTSAPNNYWQSVASSADGTKLVAVAAYSDPENDPGSIYTSTNSGNSWILASAPNNHWSSIASSADGNKLLAGSSGIYTSGDSGITWQLPGVPGGSWYVASSADGNSLAAADYDSGLIYTWQLPSLSTLFSGDTLAISWTTNQTGLALQQNSNLTTTNWTDVPLDSIIVTNRQYRFNVSPTNGNNFFQLGAQ